MEKYLTELKEKLSNDHSYQIEFQDSVLEVAEDIFSNYEKMSPQDILESFKRIIEPNQIHQFKVEWLNDDNEIEVNRGFRVQFNNTLGPYKGGLRFHPSVNESILKFLGFEQIFKNALTGLELGGAKGGSDFNPKGRSRAEIYRFCCAFMQQLAPYIGEKIDIPAGDIGVGKQEIGFMYGEYLKIKKKYESSLSGKDLSYGGSHIREEATGYGCVYFLEEVYKTHEMKLKGQSAVLSGSGNVAIYTAEKLLELDVKVLSLSDSGGTLFFKNGMSTDNFKKLKEGKLLHKMRLSEFEIQDTQYRNGDKPWQIKADIYMPCATQNEINEKDAKNIILNNAKCLIECSNMPTTKEAQSLLKNENIIFVPAKAANAGGVAISGIEISQNLMQEYYNENEVDKKLKSIMGLIHQNCLIHTERQDGIYDYKKGANLFAFHKLIGTMKKLYL